jgi:RecB family exonuclease
LLGEVERLVEEARRVPSLLARPVRIVVPSRSLREHVAGRIVAELGHAVAGVEVSSLRGLAFDLLRRAGGSAPGGDALFPIVVRQQARLEPVLRSVLDPLEDGYGSVVATLSDLLDSGFELAHVEALDECLADAASGAAVERGRAVVRTAARTLEALEEAGLEHRSGLFRRAREAVQSDPSAVLPARAVLIHGFADATGVQLELLEAVVAAAPSIVYVDRPDAPPDANRPDPGIVFTERLLERFSGRWPLEDSDSTPPSLPEARLFRAPGAHAETRAVAERIHELLRGGSLPERIGVIVRDLAPYVVPIRVQLRRLGIPFSGGPGSPGLLSPGGRRARILVELLQHWQELTTDRWLEAVEGLAAAGEGAQRRARLADLRVGLHAQGIGRLRELARLDPATVLDESGSLRLPVRRGLEASELDADAGSGAGNEQLARAPRRRLSGDLLSEAARRARSLEERFDAWGGELPLDEHWSRLFSLVDEDLGWRGSEPGPPALAQRLDALRAELPGGFPASLAEFALLIERALLDFDVSPLGGAGAGVQVLSVMEARARSFEHVFLLGTNRDQFPRRVSEDPLLPDDVRRKIARDVLPDMPLKERGRDEEPYLFAQLFAASPDLTISWQAVSDDGKEKTASPFVERLRTDGDPDGSALVPSLLSGARPADTPMPAMEHALLVGLRSGRRGRAFESALEVGLCETRLAFSLPGAGLDPEAVARARCAVLDELDPTLEGAASLSPYLGFVGPPRSVDPRHGSIAITTLERIARCPWQTFLRRLLGLEALPDSLRALPSVDPLLLGNALHGVLEAIVSRQLGPRPTDLDEARRFEPRDVPWPGREEVDGLLLEECRAALAEAGVLLPGFERWLARRVQPYLERVREQEAPDGILPGVLGVEVAASVRIEIPGAEARVVTFRADRADCTGRDGGVCLTDYKSGKPPSTARKLETRRDRVLQKIAQGSLLQGPAYASVGNGSPATGRYLFARPDVPLEAASVELGGDDAEVLAQLQQTARLLLAAWDSGSFVPRLEDARGQSRHCDWCELSDACLQGDSGARRRLMSWVAQARDATGVEASARDVLDLEATS